MEKFLLPKVDRVPGKTYVMPQGTGSCSWRPDAGHTRVVGLLQTHVFTPGSIFSPKVESLVLSTPQILCGLRRAFQDFPHYPETSCSPYLGGCPFNHLQDHSTTTTGSAGIAVEQSGHMTSCLTTALLNNNIWSQL